MRQQVTTLSAAGVSSWLFSDNRRHGTDFNASLAVTLSQAANLTYDVELTYDRNDINRVNKVSIARVTTVATVTLADHGLRVGDSVVIFDTNYTSHNPEPNFEGTFQVVTTPTDDTFTITVVDTGQASSIGRLMSFKVFKHPTLQGDTVGEAGIQNEPVSAIRLNVTAHTLGDATLTVLQQG